MKAQTRRRRSWLGLAAALVAWGTAGVWACNVPVFRYALANWQPDSYQVLVLTRGELNASQRAAVDRLGTAGVDPDRPANLQVHTFDLNQQSLGRTLPERLRSGPIPDWNLEQLDAWSRQLSLDEPVLVAFYPGIWDRIAWQAPLSVATAEQLIDSPLRQEVARRLLDGQSAVWVLLESGNAERDDAAWATLQRELARSSQVVQLPARELIETDEFYRPDVDIDLRVEFSAVRLSADDPAEQAFAALLRGSEADLREFDDPLAIPLYGRGRTHFALVGAGMNSTTIDENGQFLCGACSCQVKQDNPGLDMLMAVNWAAHVQGTAMPPVILPELTGIGGLDVVQSLTAAAATNTGGTLSDGAIGSSEPKPTAMGTSDSSGSSDVMPSSAPNERPDEPSTRGSLEQFGGAAPDSSSGEAMSIRLARGIAGGVTAALVAVVIASFWLRRAS